MPSIQTAICGVVFPSSNDDDSVKRKLSPNGVFNSRRLQEELGVRNSRVDWFEHVWGHSMSL
ncbi:unnamed protein product, partial [Dovyalis caffra]